MYRKRFGLTGHPLPKDAQGKSFCELGPGHARLRRAFERLTEDPGLGVLTGEAGDDSLFGESGTDRLVEEKDADFTLSDSQLQGAGSDDLEGIEEADLTGGDGDNTILAFSFSGDVTLDGAAGDDTLIGGEGEDKLYGGADMDLLQGNGGADFLLGQAGADTIEGGAGIDIIIGGLGMDMLTGGADADSFWSTDFATAADIDTVTDYSFVDGDSVQGLSFTVAAGDTTVFDGLGGTGNAVFVLTGYDAGARSEEHTSELQSH